MTFFFPAETSNPTLAVGLIHVCWLLNWKHTCSTAVGEIQVKQVSQITQLGESPEILLRSMSTYRRGKPGGSTSSTHGRAGLQEYTQTTPKQGMHIPAQGRICVKLAYRSKYLHREGEGGLPHSFLGYRLQRRVRGYSEKGPCTVDPTTPGQFPFTKLIYTHTAQNMSKFHPVRSAVLLKSYLTCWTLVAVQRRVKDSIILVKKSRR